MLLDVFVMVSLQECIIIERSTWFCWDWTVDGVSSPESGLDCEAHKANLPDVCRFVEDREQAPRDIASGFQTLKANS